MFSSPSPRTTSLSGWRLWVYAAMRTKRLRRRAVLNRLHRQTQLLINSYKTGFGPEAFFSCLLLFLAPHCSDVSTASTTAWSYCNIMWGIEQLIKHTISMPSESLKKLCLHPCTVRAPHHLHACIVTAFTLCFGLLWSGWAYNTTWAYNMLYGVLECCKYVWQSVIDAGLFWGHAQNHSEFILLPVCTCTRG